MPYKFTEGRRHKFSKARYRETNWPEYDAALVRRGSLTVWFTEKAVAAWHAPAGRLHARTLPNQRTEAKIGCNVLNRITTLGMPAVRIR
jgi:hypothetical protein